VQRRAFADRDSICPICMDETRFCVETNCGHLFCGLLTFTLSVSVDFLPTNFVTSHKLVELSVSDASLPG